MTLSKLKQEGRELFEQKYPESENIPLTLVEESIKVFISTQIEKAYLSALSDVEDELPQGVITETHEIINKLKQSHE